MRTNLYNTDDPEILLRLKRLEADAILDVLRSINNTHNRPEHIFKLARDVLLAQIDVRQMRFVYRTEEGYETGVALGIGEPTVEALDELPVELGPMKVGEREHPGLSARGVEYVVPANFKNEVRAWFLVANFAESDAEIENDLIFIETIANVVSAAVENRQLLREMVQQESLKREMEVAEKIQRQLLITDFSSVKGAEIHAENRSHSKVGGDFYDVIARGDKGFFLCIADVSGKGIGAALLMANLQANLRALILSENELESVIRKLHKILNNITGGEQFVTFFIAHVRTEDKEVDYINAGHNAPVVVLGGELKTLDPGTIPLGILDLPMLEDGSFKYEAGDMMFLYTDGLVEQHNPKNEMMGEEPVHERLRQIWKMGPREIVAEMNRLHSDFADGAVDHDDVTMLAVKF